MNTTTKKRPKITEEFVYAKSEGELLVEEMEKLSAAGVERSSMGRNHPNERELPVRKNADGLIDVHSFISEAHFEGYIEKELDRLGLFPLKKKWNVGGTGADGYGGETVLEAEREPKYPEALLDILELLRPNMTAIQIERVLSGLEYSEHTDTEVGYYYDKHDVMIHEYETQSLLESLKKTFG